MFSRGKHKPDSV